MLGLLARFALVYFGLVYLDSLAWFAHFGLLAGFALLCYDMLGLTWLAFEG